MSEQNTKAMQAVGKVSTLIMINAKTQLGQVMVEQKRPGVDIYVVSVTYRPGIAVYHLARALEPNETGRLAGDADVALASVLETLYGSPEGGTETTLEFIVDMR